MKTPDGEHPPMPSHGVKLRREISSAKQAQAVEFPSNQRRTQEVGFSDSLWGTFLPYPYGRKEEVNVRIQIIKPLICIGLSFDGEPFGEVCGMPPAFRRQCAFE